MLLPKRVKYRRVQRGRFNLRFQHAINQLENPRRIDTVKKDIARVMTVMAEKA